MPNHQTCEHSDIGLTLRVRILASGAFMAFACALMFWFSPGSSLWPLLTVSVLATAYLALNIGANDAANHVSMVVGAGILSLGSALIIAGVGEIAGAYLASEPVSERLREGLFHPEAFGTGMQLALVLLSGLLSGALWLHLATYLRIPVSTTHSVVGGLVGAGVVAGDWSAPRWDQIGSIAMVWVATPALAALIAGLILLLIEKSILRKPNLIGAARSRVPIMISLLAILLADYFFDELSPRRWSLEYNAAYASLAIGLIAFLIVQPVVHQAAQRLTNNRRGINKLFGPPLIFALFFFAFAHGANDVANLAAPLTAITHIAATGASPASFPIPPWVLLLGGLGIGLGLLLYGHRVIRTVGSELTELDRIRAFSIVISAAFVIALASQFGFPVSTTHILVGSIFGVGLLREQLAMHEQATLEKIRKYFADEDEEVMNRFLRRWRGATTPCRDKMLERLDRESSKPGLSPGELKQIKKQYNRHLVRRGLAKRIVLFWIITIPASAVGGGCIFLLGSAIAG